MALEELNTSEDRKRALRREIKAAVAALDKGYTKEADLQIFRHVAGLPEYEQAGTLFCFVGTSSEIDTAPILEDALRRGKRVGVPRCISRGIMEVREIRSLRDLEAGKYGIMNREHMLRLYRRRKSIWPLCHACHAATTAGGWGTAAGTMTAIWAGPGP